MGRRRRIFNRGQWEVQREREHISREEPLPPFHAVNIAEVVPAVIRKWGLAGPFQLESLRADWENLVGPDVARQSRPGRLENKTLTIFVSHSTWLMELKRMERQILEKIQGRLGAAQVRAIRLALDPGDR